MLSLQQYTNAGYNSNTHYDILENMYVQEMFEHQDTKVDTRWMEQHGRDYIKANADLESRPLIMSEEKLKCMYLEFVMVW